MLNIYKFKKEWGEFKDWAFRSWTMGFNLFLAGFAVFSETFHTLQWVIDPRIYAALFILIPLINLALRMKTEKKHKKRTAIAVSDNEAGL